MTSSLAHLACGLRLFARRMIEKASMWSGLLGKSLLDFIQTLPCPCWISATIKHCIYRNVNIYYFIVDGKRESFGEHAVIFKMYGMYAGIYQQGINISK